MLKNSAVALLYKSIYTENSTSRYEIGSFYLRQAVAEQGLPSKQVCSLLYSQCYTLEYLMINEEYFLISH